MPKLLPFRDYCEHDVINLFTFSGTIPATAGTLVRCVGSGWRTDETDTDLGLMPIGATYGNTVSLRYGTRPKVQTCGTGQEVIGMLLYDVRETDENGEKLIYRPRKAAEMGCVISGQTVPIVTRGIFLISGSFNGSVTAGAAAYPSGAGEITTTNENQNTNSTIGKFLGAPNGKGHALLYLNIL